MASYIFDRMPGCANQPCAMMKFLKVPYAEKDEAKALGARWNKERKMWYVPDGQDVAPFARWASGEGGDAPAAGRVDGYAGKPVTGQFYVALEHGCNPFVQCEQCRPTLEQSGWLAARDASGAMLAALGAR